MKKLLLETMPEKGPERVLAASTLINTFGNGLFFTLSVLYFTRIVGLTAHQVGIGLTVAGAIGLLFSIPGGHIADRIGPRNVSIMVRCLEGLMMIFYAFVNSYFTFMVLVIVLAILESISQTLRASFVARFGGPGGRVRLRALLRSVTNLGITGGAALGGVALAVDTKFGYQLAILVNALTIFISAGMYLFLENIPPLPEAKENRMTLALRDKRYVSLSALNAVLTLHYPVLEIAMPLWIVNETSAPRWMAAVVLIINTVVVTLFQVRASKGSEDIETAARVLRGSAIALAAGVVIYGAASLFESALVAVLLLSIGSLVHVYGELRQSSGSWGIGFGLPPEHAQGQYQGVWSLGISMSRMIAPIFLTTVVIGLGMSGWIILAGLFLVAGLGVQPLTQRALAARAEQTA